jgi:hypothetical protein
MPDLVMMINYPYYKPINNKGVMTRQFISNDVVTIFMPSITMVYTEVNSNAQVDSRRSGEPTPTDAGRVSVTVPTVSVVATDSSSASIRGV